MSEPFLTDDDFKQADNYDTLGPVYFASRRVAEKFFENADADPFLDITKKVVENINQKVYEYVEDHLRSDLESNLQHYLDRMVDDTVNALLSGQDWAMKRFVKNDRWDAERVRETVCKHGGDELLMQRIADLEKKNAELQKRIEWMR